jgi:hypothetical protein
MFILSAIEVVDLYWEGKETGRDAVVVYVPIANRDNYIKHRFRWHIKHDHSISRSMSNVNDHMSLHQMSLKVLFGSLEEKEGRTFKER